MTRQEQIEEAATKWCFSDHEQNYDSDIRSFIKGAEFADANQSDWISVRDIEVPLLHGLIRDLEHDHKIMKEALELSAMQKYDLPVFNKAREALSKLKVK